MNFSLPTEGRYTMLFMSFALFIITGLLFPSFPSPAASPSKAKAKYAEEYETSGHLNKIDFSLENLKDYISQGYGYTQFAAVYKGHIGGRHNGIDIAASYGSEIHSESDGEVYYVGDQDKYCYGRGYGKFAMIKNRDDEYTLLYSHLSKIKVAKGQKIKKGDVIGLVGETGLTTGPHLHFSVFETDSLKMVDDKRCGPKPDGKDINPAKYLGL